MKYCALHRGGKFFAPYGIMKSEKLKRHFSKNQNDQARGVLTSRPFECLRERLATCPEVVRTKNISRPEKKMAPELSRQPDSDSILFQKAMDGVKPLKNRKSRPGIFSKRNAEIKHFREEEDLQQAIMELRELVQGKRPLPVEKTPEYMDGPRINSDRQLLRRLRSGDFAIQAYCELHGLTSDEAMNVCDGFMSDSIMSNRRCIAYIHGRGRSSPGRPVLKEMVKSFLNRGRFRRYILAYCSAPSWDGGPGVTYVLLRKRPVKKMKRR